MTFSGRSNSPTSLKFSSALLESQHLVCYSNSLIFRVLPFFLSLLFVFLCNWAILQPDFLGNRSVSEVRCSPTFDIANRVVSSAKRPLVGSFTWHLWHLHCIAYIFALVFSAITVQSASIPKFPGSSDIVHCSPSDDAMIICELSWVCFSPKRLLKIRSKVLFAGDTRPLLPSPVCPHTSNPTWLVSFGENDDYQRFSTTSCVIPHIKSNVTSSLRERMFLYGS